MTCFFEIRFAHTDQQEAEIAEMDMEIQLMEEYRIAMETDMHQMLCDELNELDKTLGLSEYDALHDGESKSYDHYKSDKITGGTQSHYQSATNTHSLADLVGQLAEGNRAILQDVEELNIFGRILAIGEDDVIYKQGDIHRG